MSEVLKLGDVALAITGSGNFTGVSHDGTLSGNGTSASPLGVIGGAGDTSQCMPITGMSAYQTVSSMTAYQPVSSISAWTADMSSISSKQDKLTFGYDSDNKISSIDGSALAGGNVTLSDVSSVASSYATSAASGKQDSSSMTGYLQNSASSLWYPYTGNPSGFLTAHQSLTAYVPKSSISAQSATWNNVSAMTPKSSISGNSATWNSVSAMTPKSSISSYSSTWNTVSAMVPKSSISAQSSNWGKVTATAGGSSQVSSINGSALLDLSTYNALTALSAIITANSAKWNKISSVSGLTSITANKYTLSAGTGISLTNDTANKVTIISVV